MLSAGCRQTLVTAIYDLDPTAPLGGRGRPLQYWLPSLASIVGLGAALVVYTRPQHVEHIGAFLDELGAPAIVVGRDLESVPRFARIQELRTEQGFEHQPWRDRCHVLCHAKVAWLAEQATANPFGSQRLYWIDAGLAYPGLFPLRYLPDYLTTRCTIFRPPVLDGLEQDRPDVARSSTVRRSQPLVMIGMQPVQHGAIHQMSLDDHLPFVGGNAETGIRIETHVVGALFGGPPAGVARLYEDYDRTLASMLDAGFVGTEENVLTILYHRDPDSVRLLSFSTWYHEDSDVRPPEPNEVPFYRIFESLAEVGTATATGAVLEEAPAGRAPANHDPWRPVRLDGFQWTEVDGAFLAWVSGDDRLHAVDNVGVLVLQLADGLLSLVEIAGILQDLFQLPAAPTTEVQEFLSAALEARLLGQPAADEPRDVVSERGTLVEHLARGGFRSPVLLTFA